MYTNYKDVKPEKTIDRIKSILKKLSIDVEEKYLITRNDECDVTSIRIQIKNSTIGTNGKGICYTNALASGYAEFLERIQTGFLIDYGSDNFIMAPDEKKSNTKSIKDNILFDEIKDKKSLQKILEMHRDIHFKSPQEIVYLPYFSVKKKEIEYIPTIELFFLQASNGLAAGNTIYEALVQGLSEICERYVVQQVLNENISLPIIEEHNYNKNEKILSTIKYIENFGYKITVRDASINKQLPVIAVEIEDRNKNIELSFGSHPSFNIALERCLTEFLQGFEIERIEKRREREDFCKKRIKYNNTALKTTRIYLNNKSEKYKKILYNKRIFDPRAFITDESYNNTQLYEQLKNKLLKDFDDIYIRDFSFLGFPTVSIYIPNMSLMNIGMDPKSLKMLTSLFKLEKAITNKDLSNISLKQILNLCDYYIDNKNDRFITKTISYIPLEVIALFCSILLKKERKIHLYIDKIMHLSSNYENNQQVLYPFKFFKVLKAYFKLHKNKPTESTYIESLGAKEYAFIKNLLYSLNEEKIKQLLIQNKYKDDKISSTISQILNNKYELNCPNQKELIPQ